MVGFVVWVIRVDREVTKGVQFRHVNALEDDDVEEEDGVNKPVDREQVVVEMMVVRIVLVKSVAVETLNTEIVLVVTVAFNKVVVAVSIEVVVGIIVYVVVEVMVKRPPPTVSISMSVRVKLRIESMSVIVTGGLMSGLPSINVGVDDGQWIVIEGPSSQVLVGGSFDCQTPMPSRTIKIDSSNAYKKSSAATWQHTRSSGTLYLL